MPAKRKPVRLAIPPVTAHTARAIAPSCERSRAYPTARELLAESDAWRRWLEDALCGLLRPAALAGAVGLAVAGVGCAASPDSGVPSEPVAVGGTPIAVGPGGEAPPCPVDPETGEPLPPKPPEQPQQVVTPVPDIPMPGGRMPVLVDPDPPDVAGDDG